MKALLRKFVFIGISASIFSGCISSLTSSETVVERSGAERPAWANGDFSGEPSDQAYLVYMREEIYRLELGIKQTESAAIRRTKQLLAERVRVELSERADDIVKGKKEVNEEIAKAAKALLEKKNFAPVDAVTRGVYWENVRAESSEGPKSFYRVFVLLTVPKGELDVAIYRAAKILEGSQNAEAKAVASAVQKELTQIGESGAAND